MLCGLFTSRDLVTSPLDDVIDKMYRQLYAILLVRGIFYSVAYTDQTVRLAKLRLALLR